MEGAERQSDGLGNQVRREEKQAMSWRDLFRRRVLPRENPDSGKRTILGPGGKPLPEPHVRMAELLGDDWTINGRSFEDLILCGPAVVYAYETNFIDNVFEGSTDSIIWEVNSDERPVVQGTLLVQHCRFVRCRFVGVGLVLKEGLADEIRDEFAKGNEWRV